MAWKCEIIGYMIGDARPDSMTFWVGVAGSFNSKELPETVKVEPRLACVYVWPASSPEQSQVFEFDCAPLVRCGTGAHKNLAYEGWKATAAGLQPGTEYCYRIVILGTKDGAKYGITSDRHVGQTSFSTPQERPADFSAAFSSCQRAKYGSGKGVDTSQPAWGLVPKDTAINILLGDTHYANSYTRWKKWAYSRLQFAVPTYQRVLATTPTYAIYDDHDFIDNNVGGDTHEGERPTTYGPPRERASRYFDGLWIIPKPDGRTRNQGCYHTFEYQGVQFIMLDTVFNRCQGPDAEPSGDLLGSDQWQWMANVLASSRCSIQVICSGCTLSRGGSAWNWSAFPDAEVKLLDALRHAQGGLDRKLFVSGDVHYVKYLPPKADAMIPIPELISSGIAINEKKTNRGFATVTFSPAEPAATYSLFNWNTCQTGAYDTGTITWGT